MELRETTVLTAPPADVAAVLTDAAFLEEVGELTSTGEVVVVVEGDPAGVCMTRSERQLPSDDLPGVARAMVGETFTVIEVRTWAPPTPDGSRTATIDVTVPGTPVTMRGSLTLRPTTDGQTSEEFVGDLRSNIPFVGGKVEQAASGPMLTAVDIETERLRERLASR